MQKIYGYVYFRIVGCLSCPVACIHTQEACVHLRSNIQSSSLDEGASIAQEKSLQPAIKLYTQPLQMSSQKLFLSLGI